MPDTSTDKLAQLVRQRRRLLEQLLAVGRRQGELVGDGDIQSLLKLLSSKQQLITALRSTEQELAPHRDQDPDTRPWPTAEARAACAADAAECSRLMQCVVTLEREHEQQMVARRDAVSTQLRQAQSAHTASSAYQPHVRKQPPAPLDATPQATLSESLDLTAGQ